MVGRRGQSYEIAPVIQGEKKCGKKDTTDCDSLGADIEQELEAEKRIDIIGRNGNDGLHYDEVDGES